MAVKKNPLISQHLKISRKKGKKKVLKTLPTDFFLPKMLCFIHVFSIYGENSKLTFIRNFAILIFFTRVHVLSKHT